jgi:putative membrane protein (TIGR04086 family)
MRHISLWKSGVCRYFFSAVEGIFCLFTGGLLIAGLLLAGTVPAQLMIWLMHILWSISAFLTGRRAGLHGRKYGIFTGVLCSILLILFLFAGNLALQETISKRLLIRCCFILPAGVAGGIAGVNTRLRKPPY